MATGRWLYFFLIYMKIIGDTKNLVIREFLEWDAQELFLMNSDIELMKKVNEKPYLSIEEAKIFIEQMHAYYQENGFGLYSVHEMRGGRFVGWCGLRKTKYGPVLNVRIKRKQWNKGYATEALQLVIDYAINELKLDKIAAKIQPNNPATKTILEKTILENSTENPLVYLWKREA